MRRSWPRPGRLATSWWRSPARDRARAEAFAAQRRIPTVHDSYADVIADPEVDLVYNALVNSLHAQWNITALEAGKHVLSEKPLTSNAEQAQAVRAAARASSGRIVEASTTCTTP
jgi:predicted dehydrogenase